MRISESEIEIIKAYSTLWRTSPDSCSNYDTAEAKEAHISGNDPLDFLSLPEAEQEALNDWIDYAFEPDDEKLCPNHSYSLKHIYEKDTGNYVTNGQFKGAMIKFGYDPVNPRELNCYYRVKFNPHLLDKFNCT
jgi:hypothetical protein